MSFPDCDEGNRLYANTDEDWFFIDALLEFVLELVTDNCTAGQGQKEEADFGKGISYCIGLWRSI